MSLDKYSAQRKYRHSEKGKLTRRKYYEENKEKIIARAKDWEVNNPDKVKETRTKNYRAERQREYSLKSKYGISKDQYDYIFILQNGCCKICDKHQDNFSKPLYVDHCHQTGNIRGLLCQRCNTGLGMFSESRACLEEAIKYLEESK